MASCRCVLGLVLAACLFGCGGTGDDRPSGERPVAEPLDPCELAAGYELQNIVDFDPPEGEMPPNTRFQQCDPASRCNFNFNYDVANTPGDPAATGDCPDVVAYTDPTAMQSNLQGFDAGTRCGQPEYATRLRMTNLAICTNSDGRQGWGGSLSMSFANATGSAATFDASEFDGFSFWVKKASPATRSAFIATAVDPYTAGTRNIDDPFGGEPRSCDSSGLVNDPATGERIPDTEKCDGFGVAVTIEDETRADDWTFIPVRFSAMKQKGFGMPSPLGQVLVEELVRLQFLISAGDWDIWIDDISFFREPEP